MGLIGGIVGAVIGGLITIKFAKHPVLLAIIIGIIAILGYTMLPW